MVLQSFNRRRGCRTEVRFLSSLKVISVSANILVTLNSSARISRRVSSFEPSKKMNASNNLPQNASENLYRDPSGSGRSPSSPEDVNPLQAIYGPAEIPFFGSQYDSTPNPEILERMDSIKSSYYDHMAEQMAALKFYEDLMHNASPDIRRAASGKAETGWGNDAKIERDPGSASKSIHAHGIHESDEMYDIQYNDSTALPPRPVGYEDVEAMLTAFVTADTE